MNEPKGELIGLDFYFRSLQRADAFAQVVRHCCKHEGNFAGAVLQIQGIGARKFKYSSRADRPVRELSITADELERQLDDNDTDLIKVAVWSAIGITKDVPEVITYCGVSTNAAQVDNPSIAILGEGWVFSTPGYENQATKAGRRCYARFIEICEALDPDYAAILGEDSLPCAYDLAHGAGKRCFVDFFVSERGYRGDNIKAIESLFHDAYTERLTRGVYVSTSSVCNPRKVAIEGKASLERSAKVATILGRIP